jgi:predicted ester cyclase
MSLEENKALVRRWIEAYNHHFSLDSVNEFTQAFSDSVNEFLAPDYIDHTNHVGPEGLKQLFTIAFKAFTDYHETIEDIIAEGDKVWVRIKATGTNTSKWMGFDPTGKKITAKNVDTYRISHGKLAEYWSVHDQLDFLKQLGFIEYTQKGKQLFPQDDK